MQILIKDAVTQAAVQAGLWRHAFARLVAAGKAERDLERERSWRRPGGSHERTMPRGTRRYNNPGGVSIHRPMRPDDHAARQAWQERTKGELADSEARIARGLHRGGS